MPKSVRIGPLTFPIETTPLALEAATKDAGSDIDGYSKLSAVSIVVSPTLSPEYAPIVLLHEVLHMVLGVSGTDSFDDGVEEAFVLGAAATLLGVLRDNPTLVAYLLAGGHAGRGRARRSEPVEHSVK